jgi:2-hydroxymuconate-semialdehyde hydrolase
MPSEMNECSNGDITFELVRFANRELLSTASQRTITLDLDTPVLEMGILDSLSMVSLLTFVQTTLGVVIPDEKVLPENFETLGTLADLITQLQLSGRPVHEGVAECALLQSIRILEPAGIRRRWLPVDGDAQIHALEISGPAPGWVLLPGLGNPSSSWGAVLKSLRGQNAALAPDFLGFGVSRSERLAPDYTAQVRAIREAIDTAAKPPLVLVGSSAGSLVAAEIAREMPDKVKALVITGFGLVEDPPAWRTMLTRLSGSPESFLKAAYYRPPRLTEALLDLFHDVMGRPAYNAFLEGPGFEAMSSAFDHLQIPTLFIAGREDGIISAEAVSAAAARVPGARIEWLARCGHFPAAEQPEELLYYIRRFLATLN